MESVSNQVGIFCSQSLHGFYRYKDVFQILPLETKNKTYQHDHPLILEMCYDPETWPVRDELLWYRDLWELERYESISKSSSSQNLDPSDDWVIAYQNATKMHRPAAITAEVLSLLTLFTNHRFFAYTPEQHWFIPIGTETDPVSHQWGQHFYRFGGLESGSALSDPVSSDALKIPIAEYHARTRDAIYAGEDNSVRLPEDIDSLFDLYFALPPAEKKGFNTACLLYGQALELHRTHASLSLVAAVMAIEALVNCFADDRGAKRCEECGAPESIEKCPVCKSPRYRATSRFKQFLNDYWSNAEGASKFANTLYGVRSTLAHGGLLRDDLHDSGFYAGTKDEQQSFHRKTLIATRIALINWLIKQQPDLP